MELWDYGIVELWNCGIIHCFRQFRIIQVILTYHSPARQAWVQQARQGQRASPQVRV